MTFSIQAAGTVDQVRKQIDAADVHSSPLGAAVKSFVASELLSGEFTSGRPSHEIGFLVEASGSGSTYGNSLTLTVRPLWLLVEPKAAEIVGDVHA